MNAVDMMRAALFGDPPVDGWRPNREGVLSAFEEIWLEIQALMIGMESYATVADLPVVTTADNGTRARVYADGTASNNTFWIVKAGAWVIDNDFVNLLITAVQSLADSAADNAALSEAWAAGTLPGGTGTKSAKEWSELVTGLFGVSDTLESTSGRTLANSDGTAVGSASMTVVAGVGIRINPSNSAKITTMSTTATTFRSGFKQRFSASAIITTLTGTASVAVGFGASPNRRFLVFRSDGVANIMSDTNTSVASLATAITGVSGVFLQGETVTFGGDFDGAGNLEFTFTTPLGSQTFKASSIPNGAVWLAVVGDGSDAITWQTPLTMESMTAYLSTIENTQDGRIVNLEEVATPLSSMLSQRRVGRQTTPTAPSLFARNWAEADATRGKYNIVEFGVYLLADAPVYLHRRDASGNLLESMLFNGVAGSNQFFPEGFGGNAGEHPGFYSAQGGVTSGKPADGNGWWSITNPANSATMDVTVTPSTATRLEAYFIIEEAYATPAQVKTTASLGGARPLLLPQVFAWCPWSFGIKGDGYAAHSYNKFDSMPFQGEADADLVVYVDEDNGSDAGTGGISSPYKSLYKAYHNQTDQGRLLVYQKTDTTYEGRVTGANITAKEIIHKPYRRDKVTISLRFKGLVWTLVAGATETYETTTPVTAYDVWDESVNSPSGPFGTALTPTTSTAAELPSRGMRKITGTTLRVRTLDGRAPDTLVKIIPEADHFALDRTDTDSSTDTDLVSDSNTIWMDGINIEGGTAFNVTTTSTVQSHIYTHDGEFRYGTGLEDMVHIYGRCVFIAHRINGWDSASDCFGYSGAFARGVEIDCNFARNGIRSNDAAGNASTLHGGAQVIRISTSSDRGLYVESSARPLHDVQSSKSFNVALLAGTTLGADDYRKVAYVAGNPVSGDTTEMWVVNCRVVPGNAYAIATNNSGIVYAYNFNAAGAPDYTVTPSDNPADIRTFRPFQ